MSQTMLIVAITSACVWVYLLLGRGLFWMVHRTLPAPSEIPSSTASVVAVIPARNEAGTIARCVTSLLRQSVRDVQVIVVDDASTDGTADKALAAAAHLNASDRVTVIPGQPLAAGWTGKLWAVHQGVERASAREPDFLLLTDGDIEHGPETLASLIAIAERGPFDLSSFMVKLHCSSAAERLLIPAFVYFFFQLYPPAWVADTNSRTAAAAGGCMLIRPAALAHAGGIEAIHSAIIDDCALARAIKDSGGRVWVGLTDTSHSLRQYNAFSDVGRMIARTAFNQLRHSTLLLFGTVIGLLLTYIAPVAILAISPWWSAQAGVAPAGLAAAALIMMTISYLPMDRFYRLNPLWTFTLPLASLFYMAATVWSAIQYWTGRGGQWKGRAQDAT